VPPRIFPLGRGRRADPAAICSLMLKIMVLKVVIKIVSYVQL